MLDRAAGVAVFSEADLMVYIRHESVGIVLDGYAGIWRTTWSGVFSGHGRIWMDQGGTRRYLSVSEISLKEETQVTHDSLTGDGFVVAIAAGV